MSSSVHDAAANSPRPLETFLAINRYPVAIVLGVAALTLAAIPIYHISLAIREIGANWVVGFWGAGLSLLCLFAAVWMWFLDPKPTEKQQYQLRLYVLSLGSSAGVMTVLLAILLVAGPWWSYFIPAASTDPTQPTEKPIKLWRENFWRLIVVCSALYGGLILIFASLQLGRSAQRQNPRLRQLLYGFNTGLTIVLLISVLGVVNVLAYVPEGPLKFLGSQVDWTPSQIHSLSPASIRMLEKLDRPIKLIAIMDPAYPEVEEIQRMVGNMRKYKPQVDLDLLNPSRQSRAVEALIAQYSLKLEDMVTFSQRTGKPEFAGGLLVIYGEPGRSDREFIRLRDLTSDESLEEGKYRFTFKGESAVMAALRKLSLEPAKLYFTQGNGEMDLNDTDPSGFKPAIGRLQQRLLEYGTFKVEKLALTAANPKVPDDAALLILARPRQPFAPEVVNAFREYLRRDTVKDKDGKVKVTAGRMFILLDVDTLNGEMVDLGLKPLLREFGVEVSDKRILADTDTPDELTLVPTRSSNPIAVSFSQARSRRSFRVHSARMVISVEQMERLSSVQVEPILGVVEDRIWLESNLTGNPQAIRNEYLRGTRGVPRYGQAAVVAVAVSSISRPTLPQGHPQLSSGRETPRLVVFGAADWISNRTLSEAAGKDYFDLFRSCVAWLYERPDIGVGEEKIQDKTRQQFTLAGKTSNPQALRQLYWMPMLLILFAVVGLGGGVWIARRR